MTIMQETAIWVQENMQVRAPSTDLQKARRAAAAQVQPTDDKRIC